MLDIFNTPTPLNCNFQEFYYQGSATTGRFERWVKPRGCSMIRFLLIGGAGGGSANATLGGGGGGSGAMTSLLIPAMFVPDTIMVTIGSGGTGGATTATSSSGISGVSTSLSAFFTSSTPVFLLSATGGNGASSASTGGGGGAVSSATPFSTAGILQSVAGQAGANARGNITATSTIPLTGGAGGMDETNGRTVTPNYGYPAVRNADGYFQLTPILLGCGGGGGGTTTSAGIGGIGCGGGGGGYNGTTGFAGGKGGNGAAFIWAW